MIGKETISEKPLPLAEVKSILKKREEEGELTYEQKIALEYAAEFAKAKQKKLKEVLEKFVKMGFDEKTSVKLADIRPTTKEEVKLIFEKVRSRLSEDQVKKILDLVAELE